MDEGTINQQPTNEHMASDSEQNSQFCWKCKALFNSRYTECAAISATSDPGDEPENEQTRQIQTLNPIESTARSGCTLCLQMLYSLNVAMRSTLSKWQEEREQSVEYPGPVYKQSLTLKKGHAPFLSLHIFPNNTAPISGAVEIKCAMKLYPTSGKLMMLSSIDRLC